MTSKPLVILICSIFLLLPSLKAQIYSHRQLTTEDGLPTNYVYGAIEDKEGYIWVYTEKGISKFDGYQFQNYSIEDGLPVNDIFTIHKNHDDLLWMHGIENSVGYIKNDSIYSIDLKTPSKMAMRNLGEKITYRSNNIVWIVENEELRKQKINDEHFKILHDTSSEHLFELKSLTECFGFDFKNGVLKEYKDGKLHTETNFSNTNPEKATSSRIYYIESAIPYYLILGKNGMLQIDVDTKESRYIAWNSIFENKIIRWNVNHEDKEVHISTNSGLCLLYTSPSPRDQRGSRMPSSA